MFNTEALQHGPTPEQRVRLKERRKSGEFTRPDTPPWLIAAYVLFFIFFAAIFTFLTVKFSEFFLSGITTHPLASLKQFWSFGLEHPLGALFSIAIALVPPIVFVGWVFVLFTMLLRAWRWLSRRNAWLIGAAFAETNGLEYNYYVAGAPEIDALAFEREADYGRVLEQFSSPSEDFLAGLYRRVVVRNSSDGDSSESTYDTGFAAFKLTRAMPHMFFDAKGNDFGHIPLSRAIARGQRVSVNPNFDRRFKLFLPVTPDSASPIVLSPYLVELFCQLPRDFDLEVRDDWLVCSKLGFVDMNSPKIWETLGFIKDHIVPELNEFSRYSLAAQEYDPENIPYLQMRKSKDAILITIVFIFILAIFVAVGTNWFKFH